LIFFILKIYSACLSFFKKRKLEMTPILLIIAWVIVGIGAGLMAPVLLTRLPIKAEWEIIVGVSGALVGGFVSTFMGGPSDIFSQLMNLFMALLFAMLFLCIFRLIAEFSPLKARMRTIALARNTTEQDPPDYLQYSEFNEFLEGNEAREDRQNVRLEAAEKRIAELEKIIRKYTNPPMDE
jgi:uncharacterized membrane protein YeaQ/YmgE (transglycosylase-associated protein family)